MQPEMQKMPLADHPQVVPPTNSGRVPWLEQILIDHLCAKDSLEELDKAERIVSDLVGQTEPSDDYHDELADLLSRFAVVKRKIRCSLVE
jgi:hypothetical protein